jgi:AcrR family transcriptional regulator
MNREKLLDAAMRVFAESGFRGATTRRIAEAAGVNEVTLFRHFKSKSALISEAAQLYSHRRRETTLPDTPADPAHELGVWCAAQLAHLRESRAMIRKCMAELDEHPDMASCMREGPAGAHHDLRAYAARLRRAYGLADHSDVINAACTMLMGSMFADAMGRDLMPRPHGGDVPAAGAARRHAVRPPLSASHRRAQRGDAGRWSGHPAGPSRRPRLTNASPNGYS